MAGVIYTKLKNGHWGVRGPYDLVQAGRSVMVTRKDGKTRVEHVTRILAQIGPSLVVAEIAPRGGQWNYAKRAPKASAAWECPACGEANPRENETCAHCGSCPITKGGKP